MKGGYPEVQLLTPRMRTRWFDGYLERVLRHDARDLRARANTSRLAAVTRLLAANQSGVLVKARLGRSAGIPETSVMPVFDTLEALSLISTQPCWLTRCTVANSGRFWKVSSPQTC